MSTPPVPAASPPPAPKPPLKERLGALVETYGPLALAIYLGISALIIAGFAVAIRAGVGNIEGADSTAGLFAILGVAWVAAKVTVPLRILATLAITPVLGRFAARLRSK